MALDIGDFSARRLAKVGQSPAEGLSDIVAGWCVLAQSEWSVPTFAGKVRSVSLAEPTGRRNLLLPRPVSGWSLLLTKKDDVEKNVFRSMRRAAPRCQHQRKPDSDNAGSAAAALGLQENSGDDATSLTSAFTSRKFLQSESARSEVSPDGRRLALARPVEEVMDMWVAPVQCSRAANLEDRDH